MTWRRLDRFGLAPGRQMALDEALLLDRGALGRPTLSFYSWAPAGLSLGFFQQLRDVPAARALPCVRRLTGGRAIHHAAELTFSLAAPLDSGPYRGGIEAGYRAVHAALAQALAEFGVQARLRGDAALASDRRGTGMCFHDSSPLDLVWERPDGALAKGVGSAQRRTAGRVLHHGSIKLEEVEHEDGVAAVNPTAGRTVTPEELAEILAQSFERHLGLTLDPDEPNAAELAHATTREPFFSSPPFLARAPQSLATARQPRP